MTTQDYVVTLTDGTTTVTLTASPFGLVEYIPNPPKARDVGSLSAGATVSETCVIRIIDGSAANNMAEVRAIQTLLDQGRKAQTDPSLSRVYATFKTTAGGTEYRSEVSAGLVEYDDETLGYAAWKNDVFIVNIFWTRTWFYEATAAVQLQVSNHLVTNSTAAAPVHNPAITYTATTIGFTSGTKTIADSANGLIYFLTGDTIQIVGSASNDGTYTVATGGVAGSIVVSEALVTEGAAATITIAGALNNWLEIAAAQVDTVVNAPIRLELTNATGSTVTYKSIHIGTSQMNNIANMIWTLESTAGTGGAATESRAATNGFYNAITLSGSTEQEIWTFTLTAAMLAASRGGWFLPVVRLQAGTIDTGLSMRLNIKKSTTTVFEGALITMTASDQMQPLGLIQLPPNLNRLTSPAALTLSLRAIKSGGATINLDFIQLIPLDSYRQLTQIGYAIPAANSIFIDELLTQDGMAYGVDGSSNEYQVWVERGSMLKVQDNTKQRIFLLYDESDNTLNVGRLMTAKVYHRPRRLSL